MLRHFDRSASRCAPRRSGRPLLIRAAITTVLAAPITCALLPALLTRACDMLCGGVAILRLARPCMLVRCDQVQHDLGPVVHAQLDQQHPRDARNRRHQRNGGRAPHPAPHLVRLRRRCLPVASTSLQRRGRTVQTPTKVCFYEGPTNIGALRHHRAQGFKSPKRNTSNLELVYIVISG